MKMEDILHCKFSQWYPMFQKRTMKSLTISLSDDFIAYLKDNGTLILPKGVDFRKEDKDFEEEQWEDNDESIEVNEFSELIEEIIQDIRELGGRVFPKMSWSAPRDASWINNNTLECTTPGEILLLLKSSDFVQFDLSSVFDQCEDSPGVHDQIHHELTFYGGINAFIEGKYIFRLGTNYVFPGNFISYDGMEFRCFVRNKQLIAVSQRDFKLHYSYIERDKDTLSKEIYGFVMEEIVDKFPSSDFIVDLYKKRNGNYWIVDFNPFGAMTDPLLFTWDELVDNNLVSTLASVDLVSKDGTIVGQFRYADSHTTVQPSEYLNCSIPVDFVDLSTGADATKLIDFMRMKIQNDEESSENEDEEWKLPT